MNQDQIHPEYHGLTKCPFCGRDKEASWLTCSRPSCEQEICDAHTRADRIVPCFKCGTEMEHEERIAELDP